MTTSGDLGGLQDLADGIVVVNLDERAGRWRQVQSELARLAHSGGLTRLSAVRGTDLPGFGQRPWFRGRARDRTWAGRAGCVLSHRAAIQLAAKNNWRTLLILEDDIVVARQAPSVLTDLAKTLKETEWDVCFLGFTDPVSPFERIASLSSGHTLFRISGCSTTHAYLVRDSTYQWLLSKLPEPLHIWPWISTHRAIDRWFYRNLSRRFRVLAVSPSIVNQSPGFSDITQRPNDGAHVTSIDLSSSGRFKFEWLNTARHATWKLAEPRDWLRGQVKRIRGF
jgi:GR25 family glycosyltransferase involved in LPS biosynthesis